MEHFEEILKRLIVGVLDVPSRSIFDNISELVEKIQRVMRSGLWLAGALREVPYDCLTEREKHRMAHECADSQMVFEWMDILYRRAKRRAIRNR